jgi:hypothetical protein
MYITRFVTGQKSIADDEICWIGTMPNSESVFAMVSSSFLEYLKLLVVDFSFGVAAVAQPFNARVQRLDTSTRVGGGSFQEKMEPDYGQVDPHDVAIVCFPRMNDRGSNVGISTGCTQKGMREIWIFPHGYSKNLLSTSAGRFESERNTGVNSKRSKE